MPFHERRGVILQRLAVFTLTAAVCLVATPFSSSGEAGVRASRAPHRDIPLTSAFAFRDTTFTAFVLDSYRENSPGKAGAAEFYRWMDAAYGRTRRATGPLPGISAKSAPLPLAAALDAERSRISRLRGPADRTRQERQVASWAHRMVKKAVPRFSLNRGFEFYSMVHGGERQCYSQSVLIAAMLQRAGIPAGVVMVWKSQDGVTSNNGHAVTIARLSNGRDLLVDASEPLPFPRQQGLFVREKGQYRFVTPLFTSKGGEIAGYRREADQSRVAASAIQALDLPFLKSQFYYYRGERAPGGAFAPKKTSEGLFRSAQHLQTAIRLCPENPLAVYMLGRVYQRQGKAEAAKRQFAQAYRQYKRSGWLPEGARDAFALVGGSKSQPLQAAPIHRKDG